MKKKEKGVCGGIRHTNTNSPTHTPWIDCKNFLKKKEKKGAQRMWRPLCFHFNVEMKTKLRIKMVCVEEMRQHTIKYPLLHTHSTNCFKKKMMKKKYEKEI